MPALHIACDDPQVSCLDQRPHSVLVYIYPYICLGPDIPDIHGASSQEVPFGYKPFHCGWGKVCQLCCLTKRQNRRKAIVVLECRCYLIAVQHSTILAHWSFYIPFCCHLVWSCSSGIWIVMYESSFANRSRHCLTSSTTIFLITTISSRPTSQWTKVLANCVNPSLTATHLCLSSVFACYPSINSLSILILFCFQFTFSALLGHKGHEGHGFLYKHI